jgi:hypothetical protein
MEMFGPFSWKTDQCSFDHSWINSIALRWQLFASEVVEQARPQRRMASRVGQLTFNQGILHNPHAPTKLKWSGSRSASQAASCIKARTR